MVQRLKEKNTTFNCTTVKTKNFQLMKIYFLI